MIENLIYTRKDLLKFLLVSMNAGMSIIIKTDDEAYEFVKEADKIKAKWILKEYVLEDFICSKKE